MIYRYIKGHASLALLFSIWLCVVLSGCSNEPVTPSFAIRMLTGVNEVRKQGCHCGGEYMPPAPPLRWNDTLQAAALAHARDMETRDYFNHVSPEGVTPHQRIYNLQYQGSFRYENIAMGYTSIAAVVAAWQQSEGHCRAMMDTASQEMGAAEFNTYWVMELGSGVQ
jgi:uncharacterized protein YkwD